MIQGKLFHSDAETRQVASLICQNRGYRTDGHPPPADQGMDESKEGHKIAFFKVGCPHGKAGLLTKLFFPDLGIHPEQELKDAPR